METTKFRKVLYGMVMLTMSACVEEELMSDALIEAEVAANIEVPSSAISVFDGEESEMLTRTFIVEGEEVYTKWRTKETIGVYSSSSKNVKFTSTNRNTAEEVAFSGTLWGTPKYAYYPYSSTNSGVAATAVKGSVPATQEYSTVYKDLTADYRAGVLDSRSWFSSTFTFNRMVSILQFVVDASGTALEGSNIRTISVKVDNDRQLAGDFTLNLQTQSLTPTGTANGNDSITVKWSNEPTLSSGRTYTAYMTALPTLQAGDKMTIIVRTTTHEATFTHTAATDFVANGLYSFPLTLANYELELKDLTTPTEPEEPEVLATPQLLSMKFTAALNPGKILKGTVKYNTQYTANEEAEAVCTIDDENGKVSLYLPYFHSRKLIPTFELPEGTGLIGMDGKEIISGVTEVDFTQIKYIGVINAAYDIKEYKVELTNTGLPVVVINQESGTTSSESNSKYTKGSNGWYKVTGTKWQPKDSDWEMEEGVDNFMVYNADGTSALTDKSGNVVEEPILASTRVRGNVTQQMPKKPFAVKLDKKSGVLDMPAHKRWVLLANWKDRTHMRNALAFGIADAFDRAFPNDGLAWNPSGQFVELVYNGVHVGTYYLCEQIKIDENRLAINEPYDEKDGYSGTPEDYGYLLEADDGYDETWKFTTACYVPFLFKDDGNDAMVEYAAGLVRGIEDNLYAGNYTAAYEQLDLASVVDYWLIQELMMNSEMQHPKSAYMYLNDGKLYAGPIWDFDWNTLPVSTNNSEAGYSYTKSMLEHAKATSGWFGSTTYYAFHKKSGYPDAPLNEDDRNYMWYPMLVKDAEFKNLAAERWNAVQTELAKVPAEINALAAKITLSESVNSTMWKPETSSSSMYLNWGIGGGICGDEGKSFSDAVSTLLKTFNTRIDGMEYVTSKNWPSITYKSK